MVAPEMGYGKSYKQSHKGGNKKPSKTIHDSGKIRPTSSKSKMAQRNQIGDGK